MLEKYSVLMSLYIKEKPEYLELAIKSMAKQTQMPDEIVVVKDGKITPELQEVLDKYSSAYPGLFNIIGYKTNRGLGVALNYGLKHCRNELIARMDTDDISVSNRCKKQVDFLTSHKDISIVGGQITEFVDEINNKVGKRIVPCTDRKLKKYLKKRCPFNHMSVMFRKSDILDAGNYRNWFWNEDYYLWIRLALKNKKFANLSDTLVFVRVGAGMYQRRGGIKYFDSEKKIQELMRKRGMIGFLRYMVNVGERFIIQVLMPSQLREIIFQTFARK